MRCLRDEDKQHLAFTLEKNIQNVSDILIILDELPNVNRLAFILDQQNKIQNSSDFISVLLKLPNPLDQLTFIDIGKNEIQQYPDFPEDLSALYKESREFIEKIAYSGEDERPVF